MWKSVADFPLIEVSEEGHVRTWRKRGRPWSVEYYLARGVPKPITGVLTLRGYIRTFLRDVKGKRQGVLVHRLVAMAFLPPPNPIQTDVAHNDGNPSNNRASNLRWATHRDNILDMRRHGTMPDGEKGANVRITAELARSIRDRIRTGPRGTQKLICDETGLSAGHVSMIARGSRWASLG